VNSEEGQHWVMDSGNRDLTEDERKLVRWMLEHGEPGSDDFLSQLERAQVTPEKCPCGCASLNFQISGEQIAPPGVHPIADFVFGEEGFESGIFVFESNGILSGVEVYGLAGDAPKMLPRPEMLKPFRADAK
jgi:hypothetical protein